jgi:hypothetical protein
VLPAVLCAAEVLATMRAVFAMALAIFPTCDVLLATVRCFEVLATVWALQPVPVSLLLLLLDLVPALRELLLHSVPWVNIKKIS